MSSFSSSSSFMIKETSASRIENQSHADIITTSACTAATNTTTSTATKSTAATTTTNNNNNASNNTNANTMTTTDVPTTNHNNTNHHHQHHEKNNTTQQVYGTFQVHSRHGSGPSSTFIHCNSPHPYVPYQSPHKCAASVNESLNLHLGLPFNPRKLLVIRQVCNFFSKIFERYLEVYFFQAWESIPLRFRQKVTLWAWSVYLPLHRWFLRDKTGIHKHASYEYHALSTIMYWGRMFPVSIRRIRFSLSQLAVWHGPEVYPRNVGTTNHVHSDKNSHKNNTHDKNTRNHENNNGYAGTRVERIHVMNEYVSRENVEKEKEYSLKGLLSQRESDRDVCGYYIHHPTNPGRKVLFYLYGGAFLGGDAKGNIPYATKLSQQCNMDVFLPEYGLLPEYHFLDALEDVIRAYAYLIENRGIHPKDVILFGISSGGGLVVRLLQRIVQVQKETREKSSHMMGDGYNSSSSGNMDTPCGAVLMSPFVDYTTPKGSFQEYTVHDLIVNESVFEEGIPYFSTLGDDDTRLAESPIHRPMAGLPPLCMVVSEHECCYDQNIVLCNRARKEGVRVDLGVWKYMCHVWPVLTAFLPEARSAFDFVCDWIQREIQQEDQHDCVSHLQCHEDCKSDDDK